MAAAELIATANTAANSGDLTVVAGTPVTVGLKGWETGALVYIFIKDDAAAYNLIGKMTAYEPFTVITGPGTYRFSRVAGSACGVFSA